MPLDMERVLNGTEAFETILDTRMVPHHSKAVRLLERRWKEWASEYRPDLISSDTCLTRIPTIGEIEAFLLYLTRLIKGQFANRCNVTTMETYSGLLERMIRLQLGHKYSGQERVEIRQFIRNALPKHEGLTTKGRHKSLANRQTVIDVLYFLWACDTKDLGHARNRLQLSLAILIMIFLGLRPGEIVESSNYVGSNEGILYKDLTFVLCRDESGGLVYVCMIRIRNRKWARGNEKKAYTMILRNDVNFASLCPVQQLLALAIADRALKGVETVEDLMDKYRPPSGQPFKIVPVREHMRDVPLLRSCSMAHGVHADNIWSYHYLHGLLKGVGLRAGYSDALLPYNFRRGHGSILDRFVSAVQRRKQMGHKSEDTFLSYLSDTSGLNVQDMVNGLPPDHTLMETLQSMVLSYRSTANSSGPEKEDLTIASDSKPTSFGEGVVRPAPSETMQLVLRQDGLRAEVVRTFYGTTSSSEFDRIVSILAEMASTELGSGPTYPDVQSIQGQQCPYCGANVWQRGNRGRQNIHLLACHQRITRQRAKEDQHALFLRLSHQCRWGTCNECFESLQLSDIRAHIVKHLGKQVCRQQKMCLWRASNDTTTCNQRPEDFFDHFKEVHGLPVGQVKEENHVYCYPCAQFVAGGVQWTQHSEWHLSRLDGLDRDQIAFQGLILRQRLCPFCIGDSRLKPERRWAQLTENTTTRQRHIEKHVAKLENWPRTCPHPRCSTTLRTSRDMLSHCYEVHLPDCNPCSKGSKETHLEESSTDLAGQSQTHSLKNTAAHISQPAQEASLGLDDDCQCTTSTHQDHGNALQHAMLIAEDTTLGSHDMDWDMMFLDYSDLDSSLFVSDEETLE